MRAMEVVDDTMFYAERHRRLFRAMLVDHGARQRRRSAHAGRRAVAARRARRRRRQGLHRLPRRRGADVGERRVPREDRQGEGAPPPADRGLHGDRRRGVPRRADGRRAARPRRAEDLPGRAAAHARRASRASRSCSGRRWSASRPSTPAASPSPASPSGFNDLDELTSGFQPSDLIIVAARPSMGKTAFTLNIAQHAAIEKQRKVAFFSLEMSKESLVQRMLTSEARIDAQKLRKGMLRDDDFPRLARAAGILTHAPIWIDDTAGITLLEMRSKARRLKADQGLDMIIVDYLQLMQGPANSESRQQEVSQISRGLKALAQGARAFRSSRSRSSRARPSSAPATASGRNCPICVNPVPSSRTPTSSCSSIAPRCTRGRWTRTATRSRAAPRSSSASSAMDRSASSICSSTRTTRASRTSRSAQPGPTGGGTEAGRIGGDVRKAG